MADRKYNHYIPRFHFANFSGSKKFIDKYILSSGKLVRSASTKSTGGKDYLYGEDGKIEDIFCQLESQWAKIIRKIITTEQIPNNPEDYKYLLQFIILSENRTIAKANSNLDFWTTQYRVIAKMLQEQGQLNIPNEIVNSIVADSPIPNLQSIRHDIFLMNICDDLQMALIKNTSDLPFITSDHPVVKYNQLFMFHSYRKAYGYGQMGIQIFFPISPTLCLVLFDPIPYRLHYFYKDKFIINDPLIICSINTLVAGYADKELYFSSNTSDQTIQNIVNSRLTNALSPASGSYRVESSFFVFISDPSYLHRVDMPLFSIIKSFREMSLSHYPFPPLRPHAERIKDKDTVSQA